MDKRDTSIGVGVILVMFALLLTIIPVKEAVTVKDGASTQFGNEIFVQAEGFPTQIVTDIKFIDKPLIVKKIEPRTIYNTSTPSFITYEVEIKH